jgi:hypothetical protein
VRSLSARPAGRGSAGTATRLARLGLLLILVACGPAQDSVVGTPVPVTVAPSAPAMAPTFRSREARQAPVVTPPPAITAPASGLPAEGTPPRPPEGSGAAPPAGPTLVPPSPTAPSHPPPATDLTPGSEAEVRGTGDCLNVRAAPSKTAPVRACLRDGTRVRVAGGPTSADDMVWLELEGRGWAAASFLSRAAPGATSTAAAPPPAPSRTPAPAPPPSGGRAYTYATVEAPDDNGLWCLRSNPSCGRDPWWAETYDSGGDEQVQYTFLDAGFITDRRYAETVRLIWQWPDGRGLLREAAAFGVTIASAPIARPNFALYRPATRTIFVTQSFDQSPTWMVADILAHELKHVADDRLGLLGSTYADCIAREQVAYQVEGQYLQWLAGRFGGLPDESTVAGRYSSEDLVLYRNLIEVSSAPNVNALALNGYRKHCA